MKILRKLIAAPFGTIGVLFLAIAMLIRYGFDTTDLAFNEFADTLKFYEEQNAC